MTLLSPPFALGAAGQVLSGKMLRLAEGAAFRNAATGVQGVSGCLYGPAGTMGELTLNSNSSLTIGPFRAVVQQTQDVTQGQYLVVNDAAVTATTAVVAGAPTMPAQDASQFRRAYVLAYVADSQVAGVASSATTDRAVLDVLPGALAATIGAAAFPAVPPNALLLGELLLPPVGQSVTLTPYNPRTTTRGGILPVIADAATRPGHDGDPGTHVGQYRDHPTIGLQRWTANGTWGSPSATGWTDLVNTTGFSWGVPVTGTPTTAPGCDWTLGVAYGYVMEWDVSIPQLAISAGGAGYFRLIDLTAGVVLDGMELWTGTSGAVTRGARMRGMINGDGLAHRVQLQGWANASGIVISGSGGAGAPVRVRYRFT